MRERRGSGEGTARFVDPVPGVALPSVVFAATAGHGVGAAAVGDAGAAVSKRVAECKPRPYHYRAVGGGVTDAPAAVDDTVQAV